MAQVINWCRQGVTGAPGTGSISLASSVPGYIGMQDHPSIVNGSTIYYTIEDGINRESGIGTFSTSGNILARTNIHSKLQSGVYSLNPGTGLSLTSGAIVYSSISETKSNFRGALVTHSVAQSKANGVAAATAFNTQIYDTSGFHNLGGDNTRLTIPSGISLVRLSACVEFAGNAAGSRQLSFLKNGIGTATGLGDSLVDIDSAAAHRLSVVSAILPVDSGDYFQHVTYQNSGAALNVTGSPITWFSLEVIE